MSRMATISKMPEHHASMYLRGDFGVSVFEFGSMRKTRKYFISRGKLPKKANRKCGKNRWDSLVYDQDTMGAFALTRASSQSLIFFIIFCPPHSIWLSKAFVSGRLRSPLRVIMKVCAYSPPLFMPLYY
jgi:hypothetical protein